MLKALETGDQSTINYARRIIAAKGRDWMFSRSLKRKRNMSDHNWPSIGTVVGNTSTDEFTYLQNMPS